VTALLAAASTLTYSDSATLSLGLLGLFGLGLIAGVLFGKS
jgi:hypothetical protein